MTEDNISEIIRNSQPSWMKSGNGLIPNPIKGGYSTSETGSGQWEDRTVRAQIFRNSGSSPAVIDSNAMRVVRNPSDLQGFKFPDNDCPPPAIQPPNCGGNDDATRTLTISGVTFSGGAPDPNGVWVLPSAGTPGPSTCGWSLVAGGPPGAPAFVLSVSFNIALGASPWQISVRTTTEGNPWDSVDVFLVVAGSTAFGSPVANEVTSGTFYSGGTATIT